MCNLFSSYAVATQLCLGLSIVLVLVVEYIVERCRKQYPRTFVQFWFDSFKLCCGALVTHGYNVLCAYLLELNTDGSVDECAVYMIAFYYEATGITLVQMLQYGLVKYARRRYLLLFRRNDNEQTKCSQIWYWISYPGHYTFPDAPPEFTRKLLSDQDQQYGSTTDDHTATDPSGSVNADNAQNRSEDRDSADSQERLREALGDVANPADYKEDGQYGNLGNITFLQTRLASTRNKLLCILFSIAGGVFCGLMAYYVLSYDSIAIDFMLGVFGVLMFATLSVATWPVIWQSFAWVMIKVLERSLWTLFVYTQKSSFIEYSNLIEFSDDVLEAVLYIAVIPLIIGTIMFWMFSNIARMNIPFIDIKNFASDVMSKFDLAESLKVGVYSTLLYNSILWLPAELAILTWDSAGILLLMMVAVPAVVNAIVVLLLYLLLNDIDGRRESEDLKEPLLNPSAHSSVNGAANMDAKDFPQSDLDNSVSNI